MYELIQLNEHDYYIESPAKTGIVKISENEVVLIDSGSDKSIGKTILKIVEQNNWKVSFILLTHSHADHIGGNKVIQDRTGCKIFANALETAFCNFPVLEPISLYGSKPLSELRCKFLEAQPSNVQDLKFCSLPNEMKVVALSGHTDGMVGYLTQDGTFYIGDCLASEENLAKHPVTFLTDVEQYIETLKTVMQFDAKTFVPSHAPVTTDIKDLAQKNIETAEQIAKFVYESLKEPKSFEMLLSTVLKHYCITDSAIQYYLTSSTIKAYLNYLLKQQRVTYYFENSVMLFKALFAEQPLS